ncbi:intermediate cleaving peptidase 55 [[Candida] railenensis]|uniref:Intermediate cleaving peptidase 55 n=1 Tax=[Candida] railenensis TaxID=45579 RepID=A0A9P0QLE8_9ASCO|nr:intermediate cleaving peptidase 55 [[Candida] railenensis]
MIRAVFTRSGHSLSRTLAPRRLARSIHASALASIDLTTRPPVDLPYLLGQPTHETRTHYIPQPGNLTPGISAQEYYERRLSLASKLPKNSIAILVGNTTQFSSGSVFYDFQQDNDFYYMTGWLEPNSVAVIQKLSDEEEVLLHMFVPPKDQSTQLWEGERSGVEGAMDFFNADMASDISTIGSSLSKLIDSSDYIFWDDKGNKSSAGNPNSKFNDFFSLGALSRTPRTIQELVKSSNKVVRSLTSMISQQREVKSDSEIEVMHAAGTISSRAINKAIAMVGSESPPYSEKSLAKFLEYQFVLGGCDKEAYIPVVASGKNALTIHYTRNDDLLYRDETVFIDAGGKLGGYCADISRSWPNSRNGFSDAQRDIYQAVLNVNKKCIDLCHVQDGISLHDIHLKSVEYLTAELRNLTGFQSVTQSQVSNVLYPHYIGHHLGLDLHDIPGTSRFKKLVPGNVITIEPGLYIPMDSKWPKHYQGIGVRVEDDIVVGTEPSEILNLSSGCVKEIVDIESLIHAGRVTTPGAYEELVVLDI